jgi:hypothetical protein
VSDIARLRDSEVTRGGVTSATTTLLLYSLKYRRAERSVNIYDDDDIDISLLSTGERARNVDADFCMGPSDDMAYA